MSETLTLRPLTSDDVVPWSELLNTAATTDGSGEHYQPADLVEELGTPGLKPDRDTRAAVVHGRLAGYVVLRTRVDKDGRFRVGIDASVHPEHRGQGVGRALLRWAVQTAPRRHRAEEPDRPLLIRSHLPSLDARGARLLERSGFTAVRWFTELSLDLHTQSPATSGELDGIELSGYRDDLSEAIRQLRNATFADHWGSADMSPENWQHFVGGRSFRPDLSMVALSPAGEPVGLAMTSYYEADTTATGRRDAYIDLVGTAAAYRRRGIAGTLIGRVVGLAADQEFDTVTLGVDAASPTGANRLYESLGFSGTRTSVAYEQLVSQDRPG